MDEKNSLALVVVPITTSTAATKAKNFTGAMAQKEKKGYGKGNEERSC